MVRHVAAFPAFLFLQFCNFKVDQTSSYSSAINHGHSEDFHLTPNYCKKLIENYVIIMLLYNFIPVS